MSTYNEERGYVTPPRPIGRTMQGSEPLFIVSVIERTKAAYATRERDEERYICIATAEQVEDLKIAAGHMGFEVVVRRPDAVGTALQWMARHPQQPSEER